MAAAGTVGVKTGWRGTAWGEYLSEFLGTFVLIMFGDGVVAMAVAGLNQSGRGTKIFDASGDWLIIGFGWFFAVCLAVYVAGGVSGAHLNPAVTVALAAKRGFAWTKVPGYIVAQVLGAFVGALVVYFVYKAAIDSYDTMNHITRGQPNSLPTYSIFATFPAPYFHNGMGAVDRSDRGHGAARRGPLGHHRRARHARTREPGAVHRRSPRRRHRPVVRRERRLRDQPRP